MPPQGLDLNEIERQAGGDACSLLVTYRQESPTSVLLFAPSLMTLIYFIQSGNTHLVGVSIIPTEYYIVLVVVVVNCYEYGVLSVLRTSSIAVRTVVLRN